MSDRYKAYAGLGDRATPPDILVLMTKIAKRLDERGYTLRSDGGDGPGDAFEAGTCRAELYLPWKKFNKKQSRQALPGDPAIELAKRFHPVFDKMTEVVQKLIARTSHHILGDSLKDPVEFVICWSEDGCESAKNRTAKTGTIAQAIAIAGSMNIPVINLKNPNALERLKQYLD